jgi:AcrR family transcriptional regulator
MAATLREKHAEATRKALLRAARTLFARHGYEGTGIDQIATLAGATRGAVYHHFEGKRELMRAVLDDMLGALAQHVAEAAATESDPWQRMLTAQRAFLDACAEPARARVLFDEAPAALGWATWREVDAHHFIGLTRLSVESLVDAGYLPPLDADVLAHLIMATLTEAVLLIARDPRPETRRNVDAALEALMGGLRAEP